MAADLLDQRSGARSPLDDGYDDLGANQDPTLSPTTPSATAFSHHTTASSSSGSHYYTQSPDGASRPSYESQGSTTQISSGQSPRPMSPSHISLNESLASRPRRRDSMNQSGKIEVTDEDNYIEDVVQPGFDEAILRALCDMDCGVPLLLDRIKQSMVSCREASIFFKKRAALEEEYGRGMQKLSNHTSEVYALNDGKAGTFVSAWHSSMKIHEIIGENRIKLSSRLNEMSDDLALLSKEVDKNRRKTKDLATRYERSLQDSEAILDKCKTRFDITGEELQRFLISKEGESSKDAGMAGNRSGANGGGKRAIGKAVAKGGMLLKGRNPANLHRQEEDIRARISSASDTYRKAVLETQQLRQEYFNFQLPRILRALKECADEIDLGLQYHLSRYAFLLESAVLSDGTTLAPLGIEDGPGIKLVIASINNQKDFKVYMENYVHAHAPRGPRREGPWEEGFLPPLPTHPSTTLEREKFALSDAPLAVSPSTTAVSSVASPAETNRPSMSSASDRGLPTFGVHLAEQMTRDAVELPRVVEKCCEAIEVNGLDVVGIYRLSGTTSKVQKLKTALDRDVESVNLASPEWTADINNVASVLKLWFRELPEPLLTFSLYQGFIDAAKIENDRLRHIRLHERVNDLPDANYATLKYIMGHLNLIAERHDINQMSVSNLAIVFGPTLLGPPPTSMSSSQSNSGHTMNGSISSATNHDAYPTSGTTLQDMNWQCKAIETILEHYADIFVDEEEESAA